MYKLPADIQDKLQQDYPEVNIEDIIHKMFTMILEKTTADGTTTIREFGKFMAFKIFSTRTQKETVRFKFRITSSLTNKLNNDDFISQNLTTKEANQFTDKHEEKCKTKRDQKRKNYEMIQEANKKSKETTQEHLARERILDILEGH